MFFSISFDNMDKLMLRKMRKCIKDFKTVKYFKYFGKEFREEENVVSDDEEEVEIMDMTQPFRNQTLKTQNTLLDTKKRRTGRG
mmetsp:Transcript_9674/g.8518  ORF Transcript_9674/g.8518 Transcript_9674/m.8518 type:complete len:84 (+) Transcript_9674:494-745(+)